MAVWFTDNFTGTGALSASWTALVDTGGGTIPSRSSDKLVANGVTYAAAIVNAIFTNPNPFNPDHYAQIVYGSTGQYIGPGVRASGTSWATLNIVGYYNNGSIQQCISGGFSTLSASPSDAAIPTDVLKITAVGTAYKAYKNGSNIAAMNVSDATLTSGTFGVVLYGSGATADDFEGGDFITTVLHSIGTSSRDYSTIQAWHDAAPSNLVTSDTIWKGECYNDSEFQSGSGNVGNFSVTGDQYRYLHLTVAAGQSFQDHASVRTNPLKYDQSKGVGIRSHTTYAGYGISTTSQWTRLERLQIRSETQGTPVTGGYTVRMKDCLLVSQFRNCVEQVGSSSMFFNVSCFMENAYVGTSTGCISGFYGAPLLENCTLVRQFSSGVAGTAVRFVGSTTLKSCAIFGFSTIVFNGDAASSNNATDAASGLPGSSNQHSVTFSAITPFVGANASGNDLRAVAGTTLAANGLLDSIYAPNDISNTVRANPPTIGAWEILAAAAANADFVKALRRPFMFKPGSPRR